MPIVYDTAVNILKSTILAGKWLALSSSEPTIKGNAGDYNITEPSKTTTTYSRVQLGSATAFEENYDSATERTYVTNNTPIYFPECVVGTVSGQEKQAWGTLGYFAIFSTENGTTPLYVGSLTATISPANAEIPTVRVGALELSLLPDNN